MLAYLLIVQSSINMASKIILVNIIERLKKFDINRDGKLNDSEVCKRYIQL